MPNKIMHEKSIRFVMPLIHATRLLFATWLIGLRIMCLWIKHKTCEDCGIKMWNYRTITGKRYVFDVGCESYLRTKAYWNHAMHAVQWGMMWCQLILD
jgi:hypothetical protein